MKHKRNKGISQRNDGEELLKTLFSKNCPEKEKGNIAMKPKTCNSIEIRAYALLMQCSNDCFKKGWYQCKNKSSNLETKET